MELLANIGMTAALLLAITTMAIRLDQRTAEKTTYWYAAILVVSFIGSALTLAGCVFALIWI